MTKNDFTDLRNARIALESLAHGVATECIEAATFMTDDECHYVVKEFRAVSLLTEDLLDLLLEIGERAGD